MRFHHFYFDYLLNYIKIFAENLLIESYLFACFNTIRSLVLKTAVYIIIIIQQKVNYIFNAEDVKTVLYLLNVDSFYKFDVILKLL